MDYKIMLPQQVWQDYDVVLPTLEFHEGETELLEALTIKNCYFNAIGSSIDAVTVALKVYTPNKANGAAMLVVPEYEREADYNFILTMVEQGFVVFVPDISGVAMPATQFGGAYRYGFYGESAEHLHKVCPTAKDTCQYLYSVIVKRALYVIDNIFKHNMPLLVGLGSGVEVAMQVAGSTKNKISALVAINGSGYSEYIQHHKFGDSDELVIDNERMSWLAGVASVAYAKYIEVPTLFAIGSNSRSADIDRLSNLTALFPHDNVTLCTSVGTEEYINTATLSSIKAWLDMILQGASMPKIPDVNITVSSDGRTYVYAKYDNGYNIDKVSIYYSYGEYNHAVRDWFVANAETVSQTECLAQIAIKDVTKPLFAFADVHYENGLICSTTVDCMEMKGQSVIQSPLTISNIVCEPSFAKNCFVPLSSGVIAAAQDDLLVELESGVEGFSTGKWGIKTYNIGTHSSIFVENLLRIDLASESDIDVEIAVQCVYKGVIKNYHHQLSMQATNGYFKSVMLGANAFKDDTYMPLVSWFGVKSLSISGGVVLGSILFI